MNNPPFNKELEQFLLKQELAEIGKKFVSPLFDFETTEMMYLTQCNRSLYKFLEKCFNDKFLFCSISYLDEKSQFGSVPYYFYSDLDHEDVFGEDYWQAVSWDTNIPGRSFQISDKYTQIIGENYTKKNIGRVKELIWYLLNDLLAEQKVIAITQVLLKYGIDDPHSFKMHCCNFKNNEKEDRFLEFDLNTLNVVNISSLIDFDTYRSYEDISGEYLDEIRSDAFRYNANDEPSLTENYLNELKKQFNIYKLICETDKSKDFYFYFLKPITFYAEFRGVILLGLNEQLEPNDIEFFENLDYRILADMVVKRVRKFAEERENLKYRSTINYSVHTIKTMLGGLMDAPLLRLTKRYPEDEDVNRIKRSKEIIAGLTALLNLITKVVENKQISKDDLIRSNLFSYTATFVDIDKIFSTIEMHRKGKGESQKINIIKNNIAEIIPFLVYLNVYASENFYLLFFLTLIENAFEHGKQDHATNSITIEFFFNSSNREFYASNIAEDDSLPPRMENVQGNIKLFDVLLKILQIGILNLQKIKEGNEYVFNTILKFNHNES